MLEIIPDADVVDVFGIFHLNVIFAAEGEIERTALCQPVGAADNGAEVVNEVIAFLIEPQVEFGGGEHLDGLAEEFVLQLQPPAEVGLGVEFVLAVALIVEGALHPRTQPDTELLYPLGIRERGLDAPAILEIAPLVVQYVVPHRGNLEPLFPEGVVEARSHTQLVEVREFLVELEQPFGTETELVHNFLLVLRTKDGTHIVRLPLRYQRKAQNKYDQYVTDGFQ